MSIMCDKALKQMQKQINCFRTVPVSCLSVTDSVCLPGNVTSKHFLDNSALLLDPFDMQGFQDLGH